MLDLKIATKKDPVTGKNLAYEVDIPTELQELIKYQPNDLKITSFDNNLIE